MKLAREDSSRREEERKKNTAAMKLARDDSSRREEERKKNTAAMKLARDDSSRKEEESKNNAAAMRQVRKEKDYRTKEKDRLNASRRVAREKAIKRKLNEESLPRKETAQQSTAADILLQIHDEKLQRLAEDDFSCNIFENNPLVAAANQMYSELEAMSSRICDNCSEEYSSKTYEKDTHTCKQCKGKARREMFSVNNDLTPSKTPSCLADLTQVEKSAISIICPTIAVYKKGTSTAAKGHTISFFQDVETFANTLPRRPDDLPFIILKDPRQINTDASFRVRRQKIVDALEYLKANNEDYSDIVISSPNAELYPEDDILQSLPQLNLDDFNIPEEAPTAENEESSRERASTVDVPIGQSVGENILRSLRKDQQHPAQQKDDQQQAPPRYSADDCNPIPWPKRSEKPASEFTRGFFSKSFPDLFPDGKGDITKPRRGKNPSKKEYFKHLLGVSRAFAKHHCFLFVATNILRRHEALTRGNVFAKRCTEGLTMQELKTVGGGKSETYQ